MKAPLFGILLVFAICLTVADDAFSQQTKIDTAAINASLQLSNTYQDDQPDKGAKYAHDALLMAEKINDSNLIARALLILGICYDNIGNLDSCLYFFNRSGDIYQSLNNDEKLSNVLSSKANAYYVRGNFELALRNQLAALELRKKTGNKIAVAKSLNNIGIIYRSKKDYANAISYYRQSLAIKEELHDEQGMVNTFINISSVYNSQDKFDSTYFYANKGMLLAKKIHADKDAYGSQVNMGAALIGQGKFAEAEPLLYEVEQKAKAHNDKSVLITTYEGLGDIFLSRKYYSTAESYFLKGLATAKTNQRKEMMQVFYSKLAKCSRLLAKYDLAFAYADSASTLSHDLLNEQNLRQLNEMAAVYESKEKEKHIEQLNAQNALTTEEATHRKAERNYFILASILLLALAVVAGIAFISNKKKKEEKEVLLKEIHHRVKNNLQVVSSLLSLQSHYIKDVQALEAVRDSRNRVQSMALIHQNLYQEKDLTGIDIRDYISKLCDNLFHSYNIQAGKIQLLKELQPINLDVDVVVPLGLILNELITNSLKYAFPDGREGIIKIILKEEPDKLKVGVYDNGVGSAPMERLNEEHTFGYKMIRAFLQKLKGEMHVYSEGGTKVEIEIKNYRSFLV
jgi:two-component sensor histidine kinase